MSKDCLLTVVRALLAEPTVNAKSIAIDHGMAIHTARKHRRKAILLIAEIRGEPPPIKPARAIPTPTFSRLKKNPLKP